MLGGGIFVTQNKTLPGSYMNFVNASSATSAVSDRGVVAIALPINHAPNTVIEITKNEFYTRSNEILGKPSDSDELIALREIFCHANKVVLYDCGETEPNSPDPVIRALESYDFNILCAYTSGEKAGQYAGSVEDWRDNHGKKCQVVLGILSDGGITNHDSEAVIIVDCGVTDENAPKYALTAWVAGAEAGCKLNESCTNMLYDGEYTIETNKTKRDLETCINSGCITFHNVYGEVRLLEDINSLVTVTADKGEDFKSNQTIRVIDQIANDIAKLFNTKYLGRIPNDESGRVSLWGDIVAHHRELENIRAIEKFDATLLKVEQGATKKSVVVNDVVTVTNAMAQLYMTVVIQ